MPLLSPLQESLLREFILYDLEIGKNIQLKQGKRVGYDHLEGRY